MSEYQRVAFRAIDLPVSGENLEYMKKQSSRAEVTSRSFDNTYNFGDFRGNANEMMRRGYDFHLYYANFGIRKLMFRLPHLSPDAEPYLLKNNLEFIADKEGYGGILLIEPYSESGELEDLFNIDELIEELLPIRAEVIDGDLRPLYLANLAVASDSEHDPKVSREAPVPAGLDKPTKAQKALMEFYGIGKKLVAAAARNAPQLPNHHDSKPDYAEWIRRQPEATRIDWIVQLLQDSHAGARRKILTEFKKSRNVATWPTAHLNRTIEELLAVADGARQAEQLQAKEKEERENARRIAEMIADPLRTILDTDERMVVRSTKNYREIAALLAELRTALAGSEKSDLAEEQARKLKKNHPKLATLISALRKEGFLKRGQ